MLQKRRIIINSVATFGYLYIYIPILFVAIYSFNASKGLHWSGLSLKWYTSILYNRELIESAILSTKVAFASASISVIIGTICAYAWNSISMIRRILGNIAVAPLVIPDLVMGLALSISFLGMKKLIGWPQKGMSTLIISHSIIGISYVTSIVRTRVLSFEKILEESAMDLGAKPLSIFFFIKLPILFPSLVSGWLIAFILSFDDVILASFTSGPGTSTLPMMIFSRIKLGITPQINAIAMCMIILASCFIIGAEYIMRSLFKRKQ